MFVQKIGGFITYLLLYIDDIILTRNDSSYIRTLVSQLREHFDMTDLGHLKYFIGLEIQRSSAGIFVTQTKYIRDLLGRYGMLTAKSCSIPISLHTVSSTDEPCSTDDAESYSIGVLQYLTFNRPNIAFIVGKLS